VVDAWVTGENKLSASPNEPWIDGALGHRLIAWSSRDASEDDVALDIVDETGRTVAAMAEPAGRDRVLAQTQCDRVLAQTQYGPDLNAPN
jgi:hypothetical protein